MMRRRYQAASFERAANCYAIRLDGKLARTPALATLTVETEALAAAVAEEWNAQGDTINPDTMPLNRLANTTLDNVAPHREAIANALARQAATDLVCYRATEPEELALNQAGHFDPLLEWFEERTGAVLLVTRGVMPVAQHAKAIQKIHAALTPLPNAALTALYVAAPLLSSLVIALALVEDQLSAPQAYEAAFTDELYQMRRWGKDRETLIRLARIEGELGDIARYNRLTTIF